MQAFPSSPLFFPPLDLGIRAEFRTFSVDEKGRGGGVYELFSLVNGLEMRECFRNFGGEIFFGGVCHEDDESF